MRAAIWIGPAWLACALVGPACHAPARASAGPSPAPPWETARRVDTHTGNYTIRWRAEPDPIPLGESFAVEAWVFAARAPDAPCAEVELDVDAGMPQHGHGLARLARVTRLGPGHWRAQGLSFHMPGSWELYFDVRSGARLERAQTTVVLE